MGEKQLVLAVIVALAVGCRDNNASQQPSSPKPTPAQKERKTAPQTPPPAPLPWVAGSWTIVVLPDTQFYSRDNPEIFQSQTQWIANNKQKQNIQFVLHVGDIVQDNTEQEWKHAKNAMRTLDGVVPYAMVTGNHDYDNTVNGKLRQSTHFSKHFQQPLNSAHVFDVKGQQWLVLGLEFGAPDKTLAWANHTASQHSDHHIIVLTHAYLYFDNTRLDWKKKGMSQRWNPHSYGFAAKAGSVNDGQQLWDKLVSRHGSMRMVLSGHVKGDGLGYLNSKGKAAQPVHQFAVNYQTEPNGGNGYLRLMEFLPNGDRVQIKTWSPWLNKYKTDAENQFVITLK